MIKELRIRNFKGWRDTGKLRMAPLTVFFGANSSGKSSIGHLLLMLKQTVDNPDTKTVIFQGNEESPLMLGSLQDLIYHRNTHERIEFEYLWDIIKPIEIADFKSEKKYRGDSLRFSASIGLNDKQTIDKQTNDKQISEVSCFRYEMFEKGVKSLSIGMTKDGTKTYSMTTEKYDLIKNPGRPSGIGSPIRFYGFSDTVVACYQNADFVQTLNHQHATLFNSIYYLGPLRNKPQRSYRWSASEPDSVGYAGDKTIDAMLAAENRWLNLGKRKRKMPFKAIIAKQLLDMGLIDDFAVQQVTKGSQIYEVKVQTKGSADKVDLPDVGFGVSQVLPVLVQLFYAPANSIIIMEQPEIHLHPRAQSALADVMINAIKAGEDKPRNIQLIVETHSEHFLKRLQRRIAEDVLPKEDVAAYFANNDKKPATLCELELDLFGNILNWPKDFFGNDMEDIAAQSIAALKKRAKVNE
jgi:predicted ATPase